VQKNARTKLASLACRGYTAGTGTTIITIDFNAVVSLQTLDADQFVDRNASAIELSGYAWAECHWKRVRA
jgi:hypothetical protein